ncbi:MAG: hypothetical protein COA79_18800 [Planctomycetota bacterium]|nr:MAG: hypothetical protein COA79_18800 [Planctomycetota bacterium]
MPKIIRSKSLAEKTADKLRAQLEGNNVSLGDILCSERELALQYKVSRKTIRSSLSMLVQEGFVVSLDRKGYQVKKPTVGTDKSQLIAYVLGTETRHWEMDAYSHEAWSQVQKSALSMGKNVFALAKEDMSASQICERLLQHQVKGVIVNADDPEIPLELNKAGIPLVMIDTASPKLESVNQDNFNGAYQLTNHLVENGCKNIAWMGRHLELIQGQERLGGYLSALHIAGLKSNKTHIISSVPDKTKLESLKKLSKDSKAIDGLVIMWPQLIEEVVDYLSENKIHLELAVWWGGNPEIKDICKKKFKKQKVPAGVHWNVCDLAESAILKLDERIRNPEKPIGRTMVSMHLTTK